MLSGMIMRRHYIQLISPPDYSASYCLRLLQGVVTRGRFVVSQWTRIKTSALPANMHVPDQSGLASLLILKVQHIIERCNNTRGADLYERLNMSSESLGPQQRAARAAIEIRRSQTSTSSYDLPQMARRAVKSGATFALARARYGNGGRLFLAYNNSTGERKG